MPLFFFISGCLFKIKNTESFMVSLKNTLILPYLYISLICFCLGWCILYLLGGFSLKLMAKDVIGIVTGGDFYGYGNMTFSGPLWFLYSLIIIKILAQYSIGRKWILGGGILTSFISLYWGNILPLRMDSSLVGFLFFITGWYCKDIIIRFVRARWVEYPTLIIGVALIVLDAWMNIDFKSNQPLSVNVLYFGKYPILFYWGAIGGIAFIFSISKILSGIKSSFILECSNGMIVILGFQCLIFKVMALVIDPTYTYIGSVLTSMVVFFMCYVLIRFSSRYVPAIIGFRRIR